MTATENQPFPRPATSTTRNSMGKAILFLFIAATFSGVRLGAAPKWPQFRGSNSQGVEDRGQPPVAFGPHTNFLWKVAVPPGVSSPCLWGNSIFLTAYEAGKLSTLCIDRRDGKILWKQAAPTDKVEEVHKASNPASATPVTDGKRVYVYFATFGLVAYDFKGMTRGRCRSLLSHRDGLAPSTPCRFCRRTSR